jgi:ribonuclease HII
MVKIDIKVTFTIISNMKVKQREILKPYYRKDCLEVGIDEAGRGPLFGRVYVGAAILPPTDFDHSLMRDSKKLSERKRLIAYDYIKENSIDYSVFYFDENDIDEMNIYKATYTAMHKALDNLQVRPELLLVDGNSFIPYMFEGEQVDHVCITKGDNIYSSIAAASILAKVERDKYIYDLCDKHDCLDERYSLKSNKGYGAAKHIEGIKQHGITKWHRKTFGICRNYA